MNKRLIKGLDKSQKEEFQDILKYNEVFKKVRELLEDDLESCSTSRRSIKSLIQQNYSEYQSDRNATERTYLKVLDLITVRPD